MNTWKCSPPPKQEERIKILRDSPVKWLSEMKQKFVTLLHNFLRTENLEKFPWPTSPSCTCTHLPDCCLQRFPTHSPTEEPPGLSFSTFQGSSPCCNREITSGLENGSPAHRKKTKNKKIKTTTNLVLTRRGIWDLSGNLEDDTKSSLGCSSSAPMMWGVC